MTTHLEPQQQSSGLDERRMEEFAGKLIDTFSGGVLTLMVDIGYRTGLFETLAQGPGTSGELADRAGLQERYVRECLGSLVTGGIVEYDPDDGRYTLPAEHAACLTGGGSQNMASLSEIVTLLAPHMNDTTRVFREGGGIPYEEFRPDFTSVMDAMSRGLYDGQLIDGILPLVDGLTDRLATGCRVADVGCGTGHAVNVMAAAYPASTFVGYDISEEAVESGRSEAAASGLAHARFEVLDVVRLPAEPGFDVVFAFDSIHDQVDPAGVLAAVSAALRPDGLFVMMDTKSSSRLEKNIGNPLAPMIYGVSVMHCMTVSLAHGGAGLGTAWGEELARSMLADAGFTDVTTHDVPDDPMDMVYVCRR
ncbi:methyltransferase domain-containing protein [Streptomyces durbertensis]|uniref:Methyltransferase domain-containing protein n=1 Tax=Streptomyces durbertensis TaxID=2448886 RepID=A0ABR6EK67_9ACTN|nr:methyltransferase domain-containing protein [Streptomyces durbertensis]MBB1245710.1 methyltransferase domain-containing protein [Streptomyces durbertensis]